MKLYNVRLFYHLKYMRNLDVLKNICEDSYRNKQN